ncbi:MAG: putative metallo-hydrolase [SAR116 cluster bacterium MED-G04]|mgnify:CR=1 FL=1|jgi:glyoxylase-like metal-dependent hydrolase (beta-lactamase superfamily II)|nr:MBL fold metallo-hydrolase [SAR116 cluster bacterium]OUW36820.1 MAG: MBL fold metallo-hydrolase [Gammaproteobacteria bacterium TMED183]CAI8333590.1 MAG: putative metallo-hydrolase [SAR116 cluster bacterium MED-G04]HCD50660.1 MBL fold metallo-hydrolase [Alphaproteobacteria bacterium]HCV62296.1 MBL fold metallo-hydrolase [Alphaproteobacteria bacterium]|tara:strand:+ start:2747 stop:3631 length:885 start_codon:yes stop_codon:yes gene_type:complete
MTFPNLNMAIEPDVDGFFDPATNTISYIVKDPSSDACAIIDSVLDIDYAAGRIAYDSADRLIEIIRQRGLTLEWIIETHVHADHLSAAPYIQQKLGGRTGVGARITEIQHTFGKIFNEGTEFQRDGSQFDALFEDGDTYSIGGMTAFTIATPGHTPACMVHVIGDAAFSGDTLFMPDGGSARADFPGGDAGQLYDSIQRVLSLPDETRLFTCHDYGPGGRAIAWETTIGQQRHENIHVGGGKSREEFIKFRTERDAQLATPKLIIPSLQVNMRGGEFPKDSNGKPALKVPIDIL